MIARQAIQEAYSLIRSYIRRTPVIEDGGVYFKLELLQHTGSFKPRGAFHRMLAHRVPDAGVVAASGGNHGIATAYAAQRLGCHAEIFVPRISSPVKVERLRGYAASVHVEGAVYQESLQLSKEWAERTGALVVHAYDQWETLAGQGTVGLEMEEQIDAPCTVLVASGGGGLIGGIAAWFAGRWKVVNVEPAESAAIARALEAGRPVTVKPAGIAVDSLGATQCGELMFPIAQRFVAESVLVEDAEIRAAQKDLWNRFRLMAEPGGATAYAALLSGRYRVAAGERVVVLVCGSNVDPASVVGL
ncbi:MAG: threonine/serine dehydratase [Bryobacterales bacterium]|nr:threonine/serine dehydratase [Bryobacterales bacterium]